MTPELARIAAVVELESGLRIPPSQARVLRSALTRAFPQAPDASDFLRLLADPSSGRSALTQLVEELTVNETTFFREREQLDAIPWRALARSNEGPIRIWSAACSTGEEAYTLAILARDALVGESVPVEILGTDISSSVLTHARKGVYRERAMRAVAPEIRRRYFDEHNGVTAVHEELHRLVRFAEHNLTRDPAPPLGEAPFDVIVCRNVLIYFDGPTVLRVLAALESALRSGGILILGSADTLCVTAQQLNEPRRVRPRRNRGRPPRRDVRATVPTELPDAETLFLRGVHELQDGDAVSATVLLRQAVYADPSFGIAAFQLARAHELAGDVRAARRAYAQALAIFEREDIGRHEALLDQVDLSDLVHACRARLTAAVA